MKFALGRYQFGFTHDVICNEDEPYLERWILWCGLTLRLHRFLASDEDRAVHDHPWWFITMPFTSYGEFIERGFERGFERGSEGRRGADSTSTGAATDGEAEDGTGRTEMYRTVTAWRPHFRAAHFRHRVEITKAPSWTLVVTGPKSNEWGFWTAECFVHNRDWHDHQRD